MLRTGAGRPRHRCEISPRLRSTPLVRKLSSPRHRRSEVRRRLRVGDGTCRHPRAVAKDHVEAAHVVVLAERPTLSFGASGVARPRPPPTLHFRKLPRRRFPELSSSADRHRKSFRRRSRFATFISMRTRDVEALALIGKKVRGRAVPAPRGRLRRARADRALPLRRARITARVDRDGSARRDRHELAPRRADAGIACRSRLRLLAQLFPDASAAELQIRSSELADYVNSEITEMPRVTHPDRAKTV